MSDATPAYAPSTWASGLGYGGLIPFVGLTVAIWLAQPGSAAPFAQVLVGYAATIASFLGAVHWGLTMRGSRMSATGPLVWGVFPSLLAWVALLLPQVPALVVLALLLIACYGVDCKLYAQQQVRQWLGLRLALTIVASTSCFAAALGLAH
jgi:hypothetical protein